MRPAACRSPPSPRSTAGGGTTHPPSRRPRRWACRPPGRCHARCSSASGGATGRRKRTGWRRTGPPHGSALPEPVPAPPAGAHAAPPATSTTAPGASPPPRCAGWRQTERPAPASWRPSGQPATGRIPPAARARPPGWSAPPAAAGLPRWPAAASPPPRTPGSGRPPPAGAAAARWPAAARRPPAARATPAAGCHSARRCRYRGTSTPGRAAPGATLARSG